LAGRYRSKTSAGELHLKLTLDDVLIVSFKEP